MDVDIIVQRQLDNLSSGNGAYLETFLLVAQRAGAQIRIVFAPWRSFGNRPWAYFHPRFQACSASVAWPRSVRIGDFFVSVSARVWGRFFVRILKAIAQRIGLSPSIYSFLGDPLEAREERMVAKVCNAANAKLVVAEYSSLGPVLKHLNSSIKKGVLVHDLFSDRAARFRRNGLEPDFLEITTAQEADWVAAADVCFYASANEMTAFGLHLPKSRGLWLRPSPQAHNVIDDGGAPRVVFLGTRHAGNLDALQHFIDDIWPLILKERPTVELWVAGSIERDLAGDVRRTTNLKILGRVDELTQIGGPSSIGVAPTRLATGVSIKVAEYLMLGMPSVVYPLALEGFGTALNDLVEIAPDAAAFATKTIALIDQDALRARRSEESTRDTALRLSNDEVVDYVRTILA